MNANLPLKERGCNGPFTERGYIREKTVDRRLQEERLARTLALQRKKTREGENTEPHT